MIILFIIKVNIIVLIERSHRSPSIMLTIEPRAVIVFWARSPVSLKHKPFWYPFSEPHQTIYHSNIGVRLRIVTGLETSTLVYNDYLDLN